MTVLAIDFPSKDVPESLVRAGWEVVVRGGPGPADYSAYELRDGEVVSRHTGRAPERAELIYSHRPLGEMAETIATALRLGAKKIWWQSGLSAAGVMDPRGCWVLEEDLRAARELATAAGLELVTAPYIGDAVK